MTRENRVMPVPDGLGGMRVDAGLSKLLGLSRSVVAEMAVDGDVLQDGQVVGCLLYTSDAADDVYQV